MAHRNAHAHTGIRRFTITIALAFGIVGSSQAAGADVLNPSRDSGGSGGSTGETGLMIEQHGLVPTNGGVGSFAMSDEGPTLVGSSHDREFVYVDGPTLVGSSHDREFVYVESASQALAPASDDSRFGPY